MIVAVRKHQNRIGAAVAQVILQYSREELLKAFKKIGISNIDFEDGDNFVGYVNALITFLGYRDRKGIDPGGTKVTVSKKDNSKLSITLCNSCIYPGHFLYSLKAFQDLIAK